MWPLDLKLLDWNGLDFLYLGDAMNGGIKIIGGTGSGKTSGPFQYVVRALIRIRSGALFLCVKPDAARSYIRWAKEEDREEDVITVGIGETHSFNFLQHIFNKHSDPLVIVDEIVYVLTEGLEVLSRAGEGRDQAFFRQWARKLFRNATFVLLLARNRIELSDLAGMLSTMSRDPNDAKSKDSFCGEMLQAAWKAALGTAQEPQMRAVLRFFQVDWPNYAAETRESIRATAQVLVDELTNEPLISLFGKTTTVTPDDVLAGKILIIDIPTHVQKRVGQIAASIWKTSVQRAVLARLERHQACGEKNIRPVVIAGDEAQELASASDAEYAACSRESRGITIYATQTISHFEKELGKPSTNALLSCLRCGIYCRTDDPETTHWIKSSVGECISAGMNHGPEAWKAAGPEAFSTGLIRALKQGGGKDLKVEAIVTMGGDTFRASGCRWYRATFRQNVSKVKDRVGQLTRLFTSNDVMIVAKAPARHEESEQ